MIHNTEDSKADHKKAEQVAINETELKAQRL